jgi:hypothetical protein
VAASSKDMACLLKLAVALRASHSKVTLAVYLMAITAGEQSRCCVRAHANAHGVSHQIFTGLAAASARDP